MNGAGYNIPDSRYQQAVAAGAAWTRWPFYWPDIEKSKGNFDYSAHDAVVNRDRQHGFEINGILLNNPSWTNGLSAAGADEEPVYPRVEDKYRPGLGASGLRASSTVPGNLYQPVFDSNGNINPNNYWARFVYTTVSRYRGQVKAWEIWNEPDWAGWFWTGTPAEYYRVLQVGYLAAKKADPTVTILFGGLCHWCGDTDFFQKVAQHMAADPTARANNFYFDALPIHFYVNPYYVQRFANQHRSTMASLGIDKPIWVNETNVTVCGDHEQPLWNCPSGWRGSLEEQSNYIIQILALAAATRIERTLIFQFYDDGIRDDYYGIVRNNGSPRPSYTAFQTAARYLNGYQTAELISQPDHDRVLTTGGTEGRVSVLWNKTNQTRTVSVPAVSGYAQLVDKYGRVSALVAQNGHYQVPLAGATYADWQTGEHYIGGDPVFVVEATYTGPRARVKALPAVTNADSFPVAWELASGSPDGVTYDVQYREGAGAWRDWLKATTATASTFGPAWPVAPRPGTLYGFRAVARTSTAVQPYLGDQADTETTLAIGFTGCVRDNRGRPLAGAEVTAGSVRGETDANGRFRLPVYPAGQYEVAARHPAWAQFPARLLSIYYPVAHEFRLAPPGDLLRNGSFEGVGGIYEHWAPEGTVATNTYIGHSGAKSAAFGETGRTGASRLTQGGVQVTSPLTAPTLAYFTSVSGAAAPGDRFTVTVESATGTVSATVPLAAGDWRAAWLDLTPIVDASSTLTTTFVLEQQAGSAVRVHLDDVSLGSSTETAITPVGRGVLLPIVGRGGSLQPGGC